MGWVWGERRVEGDKEGKDGTQWDKRMKEGEDRDGLQVEKGEGEGCRVTVKKYT